MLWNYVWLVPLFLPAVLNRVETWSHQLLLWQPRGELHRPGSESVPHLVSSQLTPLLAACAGDLLMRMIITDRHECAVYPQCAAMAAQIRCSAQLVSLAQTL